MKGVCTSRKPRKPRKYFTPASRRQNWQSPEKVGDRKPRVGRQAGCAGAGTSRKQEDARLLCYSIREIITAPDFGSRCQQEGVDLPRKTLPRKKIPTDLRSLARGHTELCIKVLAGMVSQGAVPAAARVSAAAILLDRGWGKPPQAHTGQDDGDIRISIRQIIDSVEEPEPLLIEHEANGGLIRK